MMKPVGDVKPSKPPSLGESESMPLLDLNELREFLDLRASEQDAWWLSGWVDGCIDDFESEIKCQCGSKLKEEKTTWSKTGNYILQKEKICLKCGHVFETKDCRDDIRRALKNGNAKMKDVEILKTEI